MEIRIKEMEWKREWENPHNGERNGERKSPNTIEEKF